MEHKTGKSLLVMWGQPRAMPGGQGHAHATIEMNYVKSGFIRYFMTGRFQQVNQHQLGIFWAGFPHETVAVGEGVDVIWVLFPLSFLFQWEPGPGFMNRILSGQLIVADDIDRTGNHLMRMLAERWVAEFDPRDSASERVVRLELQAMLCRLAETLDRAATPARPTGMEEASRVEKAAMFVDRHHQEAIRIRDIAAHVNLHPKYLMQLFKSKCGITLHQYLLQMRIGHAQRLLLTTGRTILDIAYESGFGSPAQFYQAFRRVCHCTPRAYRRQTHFVSVRT